MERNYQKLKERWDELVIRPKTEEEIEELNEIGQKLNSYRKVELTKFLYELKEAGVEIESPWDFVNSKEPYPQAIPILIKHLAEEYNLRSKEGIVRALATKEAKGIACRPLLDEYKKIAQDPNYNFHYKWVFGLAIYNTITKEFIDDVIEVVLDERNGDSRDFFVRALTRVKDERCKQAFIKLLSDPSGLVKKEAERSLKRYK